MWFNYLKNQPPTGIWIFWIEVVKIGRFIAWLDPIEISTKSPACVGPSPLGLKSELLVDRATRQAELSRIECLEFCICCEWIDGKASRELLCRCSQRGHWETRTQLIIWTGRRAELVRRIAEQEVQQSNQPTNYKRTRALVAASPIRSEERSIARSGQTNLLKKTFSLFCLFRFALNSRVVSDKRSLSQVSPRSPHTRDQCSRKDWK